MTEGVSEKFEASLYAPNTNINIQLYFIIRLIDILSLLLYNI